MVVVFAVETQARPVKAAFGKTKVVEGAVKVPIRAYPASDIDYIDYGFVSPQKYAEKVKEAEEKKKQFEVDRKKLEQKEQDKEMLDLMKEKK
jgi:hypothetical protein